MRAFQTGDHFEGIFQLKKTGIYVKLAVRAVRCFLHLEDWVCFLSKFSWGESSVGR